MHKFAKISFEKKSCVAEQLAVPILQADAPLCPFNFYIETSPFESSDTTIIHESTVWELSAEENFDTTLFSFETKGDYKDFILVPSAVVTEEATYYVRAYYITSEGESDYSEVLSVTMKMLEYEDVVEEDISGSLSFSNNGNVVVHVINTQETIFRLIHDPIDKCISVYRFETNEANFTDWKLVVSYGSGTIDSCGALSYENSEWFSDPSPFSHYLEGIHLYFSCLLKSGGVYKVCLFLYNVVNETITLLHDDTSSTFKRDKQGLCFYDGYLYLVGGYSYDTNGTLIGDPREERNLLKYSIADGTVSEVIIVGPLEPSKYRGTQCVQLGTGMYTFSGYGNDYSQGSPELWYFDFITRTWIAKPMFPTTTENKLFHLSKDNLECNLNLLVIEGHHIATMMSYVVEEESWIGNLYFSVMDLVPTPTDFSIINVYYKNDKVYVITSDVASRTDAGVHKPTVLFPTDTPTTVDSTADIILEGSAFSATDGITMTKQRWYVYDRYNVNTPLFNSDTASTGSTTMVLPANTLAKDKVYVVWCSYVGVDKNGILYYSDQSNDVAFKTSGTATGNSWVAKPVILTPASNSVIDKNVPLTLTASAFSASPDLEYLGSEWQASGQAYFMDISSGYTGPTEDPTTITFNPSEVSDTNCMYVRVHYMGRIPGVYDDHVSSEKSEIMCYNFTPSANINQPTLILPEPNPQGTEAAGTYHIPWDADGFHISCAPFATTPEGTTTHAYSIWSMNDEVLFNASNDLPQCYWTSGKVAGSELTEIVIPTEAFKPYATTGVNGIPGGMVYSINVVHVGADGSYSVKSDWLSGYKTITVGPVTKISKPFMESPLGVVSWEPNLDCTQEITFTGTPFSCFTEYYAAPNHYIEAVDPSAVPQIQEKTYWKIETLVDSTLTIAYQTEILGSSNTLVLPANTLVAGKTYYVSFRYLSQSLGSEWCNSWTYRT